MTEGGTTTAAGGAAPPMRDTTPDHLLVTGSREDFFEALRPGDVLLFQGADFLAGLAQLTERRTCYHSALYLGAWPRESGDGVEHLLAHNVSTLWWRDLAREVPGVPGGLNLIEGLAGGESRAKLFEQLYDSLARNHLRNPFELDDTALRQQARNLIDRGGVGVVTVDGYLDRAHPERLYSERENTDHPVHHVRSVVALRHHDLVHADDDPLGLRASLLAAAASKAQDATGFSSAELLAAVPECLDRPGYSEWNLLSGLAEAPENRKRLAKLFGLSRQGRRAPEARVLLRQRLAKIDPSGYFYFNVDEAPGWICASYVIATYAAAGLPLDVGSIEDVQLRSPDGPVSLSTPRDLWDCYDLDAVALFARGPERWTRTGTAGPDEIAADDGEEVSGETVVFVDESGTLAGQTIEVTPGVVVPVISPSTDEEREQLRRNALDWRWRPSPTVDGEVREALTAARVKRTWRRTRTDRRARRRSAGRGA